MKKKNILLISLLVLIFALIVVLFNVGNEDDSVISEDSNVILENAKRESAEAAKSKMKDFKFIDISTFEEYYNGDKEKAVLIGRSGCQYCQIAEPILRSIMYKYDFSIDYLNIDTLDEDGNLRLYNLNEDYFESFGTPFLLVVGNGDIVDMVQGLTDKAHYIQFFKDNKMIK